MTENQENEIKILEEARGQAFDLLEGHKILCPYGEVIYVRFDVVVK